MKRKKIIINADDFGLFPDINRAVYDLAREGLLTSASLMVTNTPTFEQAVQIAKETPGLSVGIHLNATFGRALTFENKPIYRLCDNYGNYLASNIAKYSTMTWEKEFRAQIETVLAAGLAPSHLNTHLHLHEDKNLFNLLEKLAKEYGIRAIGRVPARFPRRVKIRTTNHYVYSNFIETRELTRWIEKWLKPGTTELIVHPGYLDSELERHCSWNRRRYAELQALLDPKFRYALKKNRVSLITWEDFLRKKEKSNSLQQISMNCYQQQSMMF